MGYFCDRGFIRVHILAVRVQLQDPWWELRPPVLHPITWESDEQRSMEGRSGSCRLLAALWAFTGLGQNPHTYML